MDQQKMLLQSLWRRAYQSPEPIRVPCGTKSDAIKLRFALYNAVRLVRSGKEPADEVLKEAVENVSIGAEGEKQEVLVLQLRTLSKTLQTVAGILSGEVAPGASAFGPAFLLPPEVKTGEQLLVEASQERLQSLLATPDEEGGAAKPSRVTHYYTRES